MVRVLIVEDEPDVREDVAELLREEGHEVTTAVHGADGLSKLRAGLRPALILLDLMMPVMNGTEFRSAQLADPSLSAIPVVLISGAGDLRQRANELKAAGHLDKPFRLEHLLKTVSKFG